MAQIFQLVGAAAITTGAFFINIPAGFITGGVLAVIFGIAQERN